MNLIFDLDGTLIDSSEGIINGLVYAFKKSGLIEWETLDLKSFIGPPLEVSFRETLGLNDENTITLIESFRDYYYRKGRFELKLYDGILEVLKCAKGKIALATSKPEDVSREILKDLKIDRYFDRIVGAKEDRFDKLSILKEAMEDFSPCIMIGDRYTDISAAKELGIDSIGVLYGFGSKEELLSAGADALAKDPFELWKMVCA